jgi:hypothetical protein
MGSNSKLHPVTIGSRSALMILAAGILVSSGCDPVRTIRHHVIISVCDAERTPVSGVKVAIKESWESWQTWGTEDELAEDKAYFRREWESDFVPWREAVTDEQGEAVIRIEIGALDHTKGSEPPAKRDFVSNRQHIVKLEGPNGQEEMLLVMKPGESVRGEHYVVRVVEIEKPVYVE